MAKKALDHLEDYIDEDGTVLQVSYGTPIGLDEEFYKNIPCYPMTYGQAMMILALQEAMLYESFHSTAPCSRKRRIKP